MNESKFDLYLLVHPVVGWASATNDPWPSWENSQGWQEPYIPSDFDNSELEDEVCGAQISYSRGRAIKTIALVEDLTLEYRASDAEIHGKPTSQVEVLPGVAFTDGELVLADAAQVGRAAGKIGRQLGSQSRVLVGGYSRHDCVARVAKALRRAGCIVELDHRTCFPLDGRGIDDWVRCAVEIKRQAIVDVADVSVDL